MSRSETKRRVFNILSNVAFCALAITVQAIVAPELTGWVAVGMWVLLARNVAFAVLVIVGMAIKTAEASR